MSSFALPPRSIPRIPPPRVTKPTKKQAVSETLTFRQAPSLLKSALSSSSGGISGTGASVNVNRESIQSSRSTRSTRSRQSSRQSYDTEVTDGMEDVGSLRSLKCHRYDGELIVNGDNGKIKGGGENERSLIGDSEFVQEEGEDELFTISDPKSPINQQIKEQVQTFNRLESIKRFRSIPSPHINNNNNNNNNNSEVLPHETSLQSAKPSTSFDPSSQKSFKPPPQHYKTTHHTTPKSHHHTGGVGVSGTSSITTMSNHNLFTSTSLDSFNPGGVNVDGSFFREEMEAGGDFYSGGDVEEIRNGVNDAVVTDKKSKGLKSRVTKSKVKKTKAKKYSVAANVPFNPRNGDGDGDGNLESNDNSDDNNDNDKTDDIDARASMYLREMSHIFPFLPKKTKTKPPTSTLVMTPAFSTNIQTNIQTNDCDNDKDSEIGLAPASSTISASTASNLQSLSLNLNASQTHEIRQSMFDISYVNPLDLINKYGCSNPSPHSRSGSGSGYDSSGSGSGSGGGDGDDDSHGSEDYDSYDDDAFGRRDMDVDVDVRDGEVAEFDDRYGHGYGGGEEYYRDHDEDHDEDRDRDGNMDEDGDEDGEDDQGDEILRQLLKRERILKAAIELLESSRDGRGGGKRK